eukprot:Gregarina_sp_Poly_1__4820@NODE_256_length_10541_cov_633_466679_g223_i0_p2_GENE_NODE_256_length_10541_cov_633_466679_g223_i0NODE_256_length_10541_cov_633_466679_g223_i0_p2_ORF_typecomplete_len504_score58_08_NODE_256_length_10541_cov_633_466679_g223_i020093520
MCKHLKKKAELKRLSAEFRFQKTFSRPVVAGPDGILSYTSPPNTASGGRYGVEEDPYAAQLYSPRHAAQRSIIYQPTQPAYVSRQNLHPSQHCSVPPPQEWCYSWGGHSRTPPTAAAADCSPRVPFPVQFYDNRRIGTAGGCEYYDPRRLSSAGACECCLQHQMIAATTSYPGGQMIGAPLLMRTEPINLRAGQSAQAPLELEPETAPAIINDSSKVENGPQSQEYVDDHSARSRCLGTEAEMPSSIDQESSQENQPPTANAFSSIAQKFAHSPGWKLIPHLFRSPESKAGECHGMIENQPQCRNPPEREWRVDDFIAPPTTDKPVLTGQPNSNCEHGTLTNSLEQNPIPLETERGIRESEPSLREALLMAGYHVMPVSGTGYEEAYQHQPLQGVGNETGIATSYGSYAQQYYGTSTNSNPRYAAPPLQPERVSIPQGVLQVAPLTKDGQGSTTGGAGGSSPDSGGSTVNSLNRASGDVQQTRESKQQSFAASSIGWVERKIE